MKKRILLIGIALASGIMTISPGLSAQDSGFTIKGQIQGLESENVYLLLRTEAGIDTVARSMVKDNAFELKGMLEEPALCLLSTGPQQGMQLFVENTGMTVSGELPDIEINGSKSHDDLEKMSTLSPRLNEIRQQLAVFSEAYREAATNNDSAKVAAIREEAAPLAGELETAQAAYENMLTEYIKTSPATFATPYMILSTFYSPDPNEFLPAFEKFPEEVKNSMLGKVLKEKLDQLAMSAIGQKAPDITGQTPEGEEIALSEVKGKITLIDFWASWCGPCRRENPNVVKLYEKYHTRGFNILGVSLDTDAGKWKQAITDDGLEWSHVSDLKGWESTLSEPYAVTAIPHTVLIDEKGVIIAKNLRGRELEAKVAEVLGE